MGHNFNIGFLKTVQAPIIESLKKAKTNIEYSFDLLKENKPLTVATTNATIAEIHSAKGALQMIDLPGTVLLLVKTEEVLKQLKESSNQQKIYDILTVVSKAIDNIVYYIEQLSSGEKDRPLKLFEDYQRLNVILGKESSAKDLFFPKLDILKPEQKDLEIFFKVENIFDEKRLDKTLNDLKNITTTSHFDKTILEVGELVSQVKEAYELNKVEKVTGVMFIQSLQEKLNLIKKTINEILDLKINKHYNTIYHLYLGFLSVIEPNNNNDFPKIYSEKAKEIKFNLLKISAETRTLYKELEELKKLNNVAVNQSIKKLKINKDLQKELLHSLISFLIEKPELKNNKEIELLTNYIDLNDYIEQLSNTKMIISLSQKDNSSIENIQKIWIDIKEEFKIITDKEQKTDPSVFMKKFHNLFTKLNENINEINFDLFKPISSSLLTFILKITTKQVAYNDIIKEELSFTINFLDKVLNTHINTKTVSLKFNEGEKEQLNLLISRINELEKNKGEQLIGLPYPQLSKAVQNQEKLNLSSQAFEQLSSDLLHVEEILDKYFKSKGENFEELPKVISYLNSSRGVLQLTGKKELANLVKNAISVIADITKSKDSINNINSSDIKKANEQIASIILYSQAMKNKNEEEASQILQRIILLNKDIINNNIDINNIVNNEIITLNEIVDNKEIKKEPDIISNSSSNNTNIDKINTENNNYIFLDKNNNEELGEFFIMEAREVLDSLPKQIHDLRKDLTNKTLLTDIRRAFHTLKGSSRMVDYKYYGESSWLVEQTLNKIIEAEQKPTNILLSHLDKATTLLNSYLIKIENSTDKTVNINLMDMFNLMKEINNDVSFSDKVNINEVSNKIENQNANNNNITENNNEVLLDFSFDENDKATSVDKDIPILTDKVDKRDETINEFEELNIETQNTNNNISNKEDNEEVIDFFDLDLTKSNEEFEEKEKNSSIILINGKEINKELYDLFDKESQNIFINIQEQLNKEDLANYNLDFVRNFHTLSSISQSVNLEQIAIISQKIEKLLNQTLNINYSFNKEEKQIIKDLFESIKLIKNQQNIPNIDFSNNLYLIFNLENNINNKIDSQKENEKSIPNIPQNNFNFENSELKEFLIEQFNKLNNKIDSQKEEIDLLKNEIKDLKDSNSHISQNIKDFNIENIISSFEEKINNILNDKINSFDEKQNDKLTTLKEEVNAYTKKLVIQGVKLMRQDIAKINANTGNGKKGFF